MPLMRTPEGAVVSVPLDQVEAARSARYTDVAPVEAAAASTPLDRGEHTTAGAALAGGTGLLSGLTVGLSDAAIGALATQGTTRDVAAARAAHPIISTGSEVAGAILPAILSGGESLAAAPTRLIAEGGQAVARAGEAAGLGRLGGAALGAAGEGALYGSGQTVSELSLSQDPITLERVSSSLSSNMLYGAGLGAGAGVLAKGAELGLSRAKRAIDSALVARSEGPAMRAVGELEAAAAAEPAAITADTDVALLDRKGLKVARDQEVEAVRAAQAPEREAFVDDLRAARDAAIEEKTWIATQGAKTREVRSIGKLTLEADQRIDKLLKNPIELVESPQKSLSALRQQEHALSQMQAWGERETQRYVDEIANARDTIRGELLGNKVDGYLFGKGGISTTSPVVDDIVERIFQERYPHPDRLPTNLQVLNNVPTALDRNKALQDRLAKLAEAPSSPRLAAIDQAEQALGVRTAAPKAEPAPSLGHEVFSAAASFAGPLGAIASHGTKALGGLRKVAAAAAERSGRAASNFLDVASKAAGKAAPYAPAVATKVLAAVRYSDEGAKDEQPKTLAELHKLRTAEVKSQVHMAPDGSFQMRPEARQKLAARFDGIRAMDPRGADHLETIGARRIEFLASIIPRRPDIGGTQIGPDRWQPSDLAMRSWARSVAAVEDPHAVLDRAAAGRVVPEDAAALRAVYPELLREWTDAVAIQLPSLRANLPYKRRLALSILTGVPVDPAMTPAVIREIQSMYAAEPGTMGGTQAPVATPQFGSVKRSDPGTPAQRRQGLTPA